MARISFNSGAAPKRDTSLMPAAEYLFHITNSEMKANRGGTGQRLNLEFTCLDDGYKGRKMFVGLNIDNPNPEAQRIAESELREIVEACGKAGQIVEDSAVLHNIPMLIKTKIKKDPNGVYDDQVVPVWYKPASTPRSASNAPQAGGGFKPPVAAATGFKPPVRQAALAQAPAPTQQDALTDEQRASIEAGHTTAVSHQQLQSLVDDANQAQAEAEAPAPAPAAGGAPAWMRRG